MAGQPANTGVGLRAYVPGLGEREPAGSLVPPSPSPSLSPPQGLASFRDKGPLRPQTQLGGGELRLPELFWDLQTRNNLALTSPGRLMPQERTEDTGRSLGAHTATCNYTRVYTHSVFQVSHRHRRTAIQVCTGTSVTCMPAHRAPHTHIHLHATQSLLLIHTRHVHAWAYRESSLLAICWPLSHTDDPLAQSALTGAQIFPKG